MIALALAALLAAGTPLPVVARLYAVKQDGGGIGFVAEETILAGVFPSKSTRGAPAFWIIEQRRADSPRGPIKHQWIDSRACPAASDVIQSARALISQAEAQTAQAEAAARLGIRKIPTVPPFDTPILSVTRFGEHLGAATLHDRQAADSWWRTERAVADCWRTTAPIVGGKPVEASLNGASKTP